MGRKEGSGSKSRLGMGFVLKPWSRNEFTVSQPELKHVGQCDTPPFPEYQWNRQAFSRLYDAWMVFLSLICFFVFFTYLAAAPRLSVWQLAVTRLLAVATFLKILLTAVLQGNSSANDDAWQSKLFMVIPTAMSPLY
jgi:hypothetical protein